MTKRQTDLVLGNQAYSIRSYAVAIEHYQRALKDSDHLSHILEFNINLAKRRLSESDPQHPLLSASSQEQNAKPTNEEFIPEATFDIDFYLERYPDVKYSSLEPLNHYYQFGEAEGRWPNRFFDPFYYLQAYSDVRDSGLSPFRHYIEFGYQEGRAARELGGKHSRGTILLVTHDTDVGGAQHVLRLFAEWIANSTRFNVRIAAMRRGNLHHCFAEIAPLFVICEHPEDTRSENLREWMGTNVVGVFVNSIASAGILKYLPDQLPVVTFIHELPNILDGYKDELAQVRRRVSRVIGGGPDVSRELVKRYGIRADRIYSSVSYIESLPVDVDMIERRRAARLMLGCLDDRFVVMGCGVLHWRKSPDKFIEVAELVLATGLDAEFVWVGGGPDEAICNALITEKGLQGRVRFTGYEPQVAEKLAAGDLFLLSSQEDPFPLVALYAAQAGMPIICFQEAGGIESFVSKGSGMATPFMDINAMAEAVLAFSKDSLKREKAGRIGELQVRRQHTINVVGPVLLNHLREVAGLAPELSIVLPNYNYETYLPERLDSIANQTFQDFEVILLDDASTDGSAKLLEDFSRTRPACKVLINTDNSGSPFLQWLRGMNMAHSDLIWLAEADDRCEPRFLETMIPIFDDRNVRIASCSSQPISADGAILGDYRPLYLNRISPGRWDKDYVATDHEEANAGLGIANSIPNASGVIFRKFSPEPEFVQELSSMRLCGDWYFYVRAMRGGLVGFSSKLMNDHRRHCKTVTHQLEGSFRYFKELATVRNYLGRTYTQSDSARNQITNFLQEDYIRFNVPDPKAMPKANAPEKALPSLLVVTPDLSPGGGQVFALSVANEWARKGGRVVLLNVANQASHPAMVAKISGEVTCIEAADPGVDLATLIKRFDINAIHSSIWWADRWIDNNRAALPLDMPWVISMHGCYETILHNPDIDLTFPERITRMINRAIWVYTAKKNLEVFHTFGRPNRLLRIPNGVTEEVTRKDLRRQDYGLRHDAIIVCLASRAIAAKGWFEAVRLTERLNQEGHTVDLLLIGEGPAAEAIREKTLDCVHLVGQVSNLQDYLSLADIGLLPSYFEGESFPLVLLEMMSKSLPLVASDIGEIPWIIGKDEDAAGIIVHRTATGIDEDELHDAVLNLLDPTLRHYMAAKARARYQRDFTVEKMVKRYAQCYW